MPVEAWGSYPPEMNAGRYEGTGPASWLAASASWATLAADAAASLASFLSSKGTAATEIYGFSSIPQLAAAGTFGGWLGSMHALADTHSITAQTVADAYSVGQASMIPVPAVTANRTAEAAVVSSSILGAADPTAVALNVQYGEMWGQNATTMMGYDSLATGATTFKPTSPPPPLVNGLPGENLAQAAAQQAQQGTQNSATQTNQTGTQMMQQVMGVGTSVVGQAVQMPAQLMQSMTGALTQVFQPVQQVMGQLASPMQGVLGNGLGSGSNALGSAAPRTPGGLAIRGGLPLGSLGVGGSGIGTGASAGGLGRGMELAQLGKPVSSAARVGPQFTGVSLAEKVGVPATAGANNGGTGGPMAAGRGAMGAEGTGRGGRAGGTEYKADDSGYRNRSDRRRDSRDDEDDSRFD